MNNLDVLLWAGRPERTLEELRTACAELKIDTDPSDSQEELKKKLLFALIDKDPDAEASWSPEGEVIEAEVVEISSEGEIRRRARVAEEARQQTQFEEFMDQLTFGWWKRRKR